MKLLLGILLLVMTQTTTATTTTVFSLEDGLIQRYNNEIKHFWQQGEFASFKGVEDVDIHYAQFISPTNNKCIVIVSGRSEGYLKYKELSYDLANQGYNLFLIDHRGQGLSGKMLNNSQKGYVASFDHYSDDLHQFVETVVKPACQQEIFILAHSMGGAISARYMQRFQTPITAAVLSSPMIAINGGGLPLSLAKLIINTGNHLSKLFTKEPWYFLGQNNYQATSFEENRLMQSATRYQIFVDLYQQEKALQLGGVTFQWLQEALKANKDLFNDIEKLTTPVQVIQAGNDTIVDNQAQNEFCQALHNKHSQSCPSGKPIVIENALHEIFFESDQYRLKGIETTLNWFAQHTTKN